MLNNVPHADEIRDFFQRDLVSAVLAALRAGKTRLRTFQEFPELNTALDTYNIKTLLNTVRQLAFALVRDSGGTKRVRICVQKSMGAFSLKWVKCSKCEKASSHWSSQSSQVRA